jgi:glycosyltransferase involved in cell wall biosynthesis
MRGHLSPAGTGIRTSKGLAGGELEEKRKRVLVYVGHYLPGYKSGGPIRSIANVVSQLSNRFEFYVVTRDREATDGEPYPNLTPNSWCDVGDARVLYCSSISHAILYRAFRDIRPDIIYLNSFQNTFTRIMVVLRRVGALGNTPVLLAPRGEFSSGAMKIKRTKKILYRFAAKILGLHENLHWHVSTSRERADLLRAAPAVRINPDSIHIAANITQENTSKAEHPAKDPGAVKFVYMSRISEMKNLLFLLQLLPELCGQVEFNIYGSVADSDVTYWKECCPLLAQLPGNVKADYRGQLEHGLVPQVLHDHHFFVLPTKGENFCHAVVESLVNNTPVVISDETPWTGLNAVRAGFDVPLRDKTGWIQALQACVDMGQQVYSSFVSGAREYSRQFSVQEAVSQNVMMFETALLKRSATACSVTQS